MLISKGNGGDHKLKKCITYFQRRAETFKFVNFMQIFIYDASILIVFILMNFMVIIDIMMSKMITTMIVFIVFMKDIYDNDLINFTMRSNVNKMSFSKDIYENSDNAEIGYC